FQKVFQDISSGDWCADAVMWASEQGLVTGYLNGDFGKSDTITREQLAVILWRHAGMPSANIQELTSVDFEQAGNFAREALCWAVENGILQGYDGNILAPKRPATRAQAAKMIMNYLECRV
ncbi:MAG: S-layer homology domain-containing protein, partial [Candidatus Gastranaerophilales bacterium]|nr:S-layer homology domain-containing protein [Candidatus Gastranaerophilales bacterium]